MRNAVSAVIAVAARIVIGLNGIVVSESLEIKSDDPRQLFACRTFFRRHNGVEYRIVRHQVFDVDPWAIVKIDLDFLNLPVHQLEPRADVDGFSLRRLRRHMLNHVS
jgi:hypothetical protein